MSYLDVVNRNLPTTIVVMCSAGVPAGKFSGSRAFTEMDANLVFVNCPDNNWFIGAIPGLGETVPEIAESIRQAIASTNPNQVVFYGGSMGGYGAFLYGALVDADWTIATGVEVSLGIKGGFFNKESSLAGSSVEIPDLARIVASASGNFVLIAGEESSIDLYCAEKLLMAENAEIKTIVNGEHTIPYFLNKEIGIKRIIEDVARDGRCELLNFYCGKVLSYTGYANLLYEFDVEEITHEDFLLGCEKYMDELDPVSLSYYLYRAGIAFKRRGEVRLSFDYFKAAHHQNGFNSKIIALLAQAYFDLKDFEASRIYARRSIELADPQVGKPNCVAYFTLFHAQKELGAVDKACQTLLQLEEVAPKSGPIREKLNFLRRVHSDDYELSVT